MIHRAYLFDSVRYYLDANQSLTQEQVDGLNVLVGYYEGVMAPAGRFDDRMFAYILATAWHETAFRLQPIAEYGKGAGKPYGEPDPVTGQAYYGRGYVQLTWKDNYVAQDQKLGLGGRLVAQADLALEPELAVQILFGGMLDGDFTGCRLADFFTVEETNWYDARTIVNGHDCASDIAGYAEKFLNAVSHTFDAPQA